MSKPEKDIIIKHPRKDYTNQRFGYLLVLKPVDFSKEGGLIWKCQCDCGVIKNIRGEKLSSTMSCGCYRIKKLRERFCLPKGVSGFNYLFDQYKRRAKLRNIEFLLSKDEFYNLVTASCFYCNVSPYAIIHRPNDKYGHSAFVYNGIDRKDNTLGYIIKNVVACCVICNFMKRDLTLEEFLVHIKRINNWSLRCQTI